MSIMYSTNDGTRPFDALNQTVNAKLDGLKQAGILSPGVLSYAERLVGENLDNAVANATELLIEYTPKGHCLVRAAQADGTIVSFSITGHRADFSLDIRLSCGTLEQMLKDHDSGEATNAWIAERLRAASSIEEVKINVAGRHHLTKCFKAFILEYKSIWMSDLKWLLS